VSRRGSFAALALSVALLAGAVVVLVGGVALGAWQPAGPVRAVAPTSPTGPTNPDAVAYGEFLDDVRAGRVFDVFQDINVLQVNAEDGFYVVQLPFGEPDVFGDIQAAAAAGGVPTPAFGANSGPDETAEPVSYAVLLQQVRAGRIYDVFHEDDQLMVNAVDGSKEVVVPAGANVLDDLEAAARQGGVPAPAYTKVPNRPD